MIIQCPYCKNDDKTMIEVHKINHITTQEGLKTEIIYHCEVCSKEFKPNEFKQGTN